VVDDVLQRQLEKAQIILRLHRYERVDVRREALESYFLEGDEQRLLQVITVAEPELMEVATIEGGEED
jgi:hypothetical protein